MASMRRVKQGEGELSKGKEKKRSGFGAMAGGCSGVRGSQRDYPKIIQNA